MMRQDLNMGLAAVLTTLADEPTGEAPSGILYAAMMGADANLWTLDAWNMLLGVLKKGELVTVAPSHMVTITEKGRGIAAKCMAHARSVRA